MICDKIKSPPMTTGSPFLVHCTEVAGPPVVTQVRVNLGGLRVIRVNWIPAVNESAPDPTMQHAVRTCSYFMN